MLAMADAVLHDALVSGEVLALIPARAQVINVGKRCGQKSSTQEQINDLLVRLASSGNLVVRLKGGDPLIFGRAGEELDALRAAGLEVEIVPGVTAALAAAAQAQVSLTDRRTADQVLVVSGHREPGKTGSEWYRMVTSRTTVVVYMPGEYFGIAEDLLRAGMSASTPCAIISRALSSAEQSYQTTLGLLHRAPVLPSPSILIAGETLAAASQELQSFYLNRVPLQGAFSSLPFSPVL